MTTSTIAWVSRPAFACAAFLLSSTAAFAPISTTGMSRPSRTSRNIGNIRGSSSSSSNDKEEDSSESSDVNLSDFEFEKKLKVAQAQSKIDRILASPDAPFDVEKELEKVISISPGMPLPTTGELESPEQLLDKTVCDLESQLYAAVDRQDFSAASKIQSDISQIHIDDCGSVLQVNSNFYKAFSDKDYDAMDHIWWKDASIACIHPSHTPLVGTKAVMNSWKHMFDSTDGSFQKNWMEPSGIRLVVKGSSAICTCDEEVYARIFVRGKKRETELINKLTATNIFRKLNGSWYMVHHHASWHADSDAAKAALKNTGGGSNARSTQSTKKKAQIMLGDGKPGDFSKGADGILGMQDFGPLLGDGAPPSSGNGEGRPVKRVIMGSLSDILNGGLGDILGGGGEDDDDNNDSIEGNAIIHLGNSDEEDEDDDSDDDDSDDDDESDAVSIIKEWASRPGSTEISSSKSGGIGNAPKDALRQNCISALRKLCHQGSISPKQKRVLLTDIITCSAKGEFSMVEVAYELLCGEGEDKDAAEEEFADQCRVFALSLPEN